MIKPPIDKLIDKVGDKYTLTVAISKRAKMLAEKDLRFQKDENLIERVANEIYDGTVIVIEE
jgi:DNA-directed RNA polymerase omega subunit